ncbi:MAG: ABC transporter permease [Clostridia bacterium]|nr:ABC transporter permease [Clostridia bacterium]
MASYNLNETLKARAASQVKTDNGEVKLDDVSRVKVLSPGRKVFKRFIKNRLAVFGTTLLVIMFILSFLGPIFYPYGQKDIFYRYDTLNTNYASVKDNTTFETNEVDPSVEVESGVNRKMTTNIKAMNADGKQTLFVEGMNAVYEIEKNSDELYTLNGFADSKKIAVFGSNLAEIGSFDGIAKTLKYNDPSVDLGEAFVEALKTNCKGNKSGEFEFEGTTYYFEPGSKKSFTITALTQDFLYEKGVAAMPGAFEDAALAAVESGELFTVDGKDYIVTVNEDVYTAYQVGEKKLARIYTTLGIDTIEKGAAVSAELKNNALLAAFGSGTFTADGKSYTVKEEDGAYIIKDDSGKEFGELTHFIIRRYNGDDTVEYELKKALAEEINAMVSRGEIKSAFTHAIPMQTEDGRYQYDENGKLQYADTELRITQKEVGQYTINCDQITYVIDTFAAPSGAHILGTDGDGFDVFARIMYGGRISLMVGFVVVFLECFLGIIMGGLAGYYGKWVDFLIMRLVDIFYCLPSMPIMIILGAMMDAMRLDTYIRLIVMMAMLGIMGWAGVARLVRGQILMLREQEFMLAAEATGIRVKHRIFRHLIPNVMPQLIVSATMGMGGTILTESTLSFLGLGVKHPLATWGTIINSVSSASAMAHYAYIWIPVGLLICLTVIAFNFVGDGLRDAYDPKSKQ